MPARMPAGRCRLTEAQGRRHQEVLAALPSGLKEPPAQLGLASCLQAFAAPELMCGKEAYACDACARAGAPAAAHGVYTAQDARSATHYSPQDATPNSNPNPNPKPNPQPQP